MGSNALRKAPVQRISAHIVKNKVQGHRPIA
jgi:hypothetical protein